MVLWKHRQQQEAQQDTQAHQIRNEEKSAGEASGDHAEPFPFVALPAEPSIPIDSEFQTRQSYRRQGLQEDLFYESDETDSLPTSISPQSLLDIPSSDISSSAASSVTITNPAYEIQNYNRAILNPQHLRHGISQDNQYIRRGIQQILESNYRPSQAVAIVSNDGQRTLVAGYSDVQLPSESVRRQREQESRLRHELAPFLLESQVDQQREWLEVEFHPGIQSALLDRHHQHRDEEFLLEYSKHLKDGDNVSPQIQEFLLEQAKALETLTQRPSSVPFSDRSNEASRQELLDESSFSTDRQYSSSSISMRIWMGSHTSNAGETPNEGNQTTVSDLLLLPPHIEKTRDDGRSETDNADDMDSRFSDVDYMTDYQWTALRKAIVRSDSSLVGKWKKAMKASSDLPSQPVPPKRTIDIRTSRQQSPLTEKAAEPTRGVARMPNYDSGDDELDPLVRPPSPQQRQESPEKHPVLHPNESSVVSPKLPQKQIQIAMNEAVSNIQTRVCQICQQSILEKEEENGNNKITCSMCGATSCYFCRKIIPASGLDHFNTDGMNSVVDTNGKCPLWTGMQTDLEQDKKLARDMLMEIADQVLQDTFQSKR